MAITAVKPISGGTASFGQFASPVIDDLTSLDSRVPAANAWVDWSATFNVTAATTNPTKGNSVYSAGYLLGGKTCDYQWKFAPGTTYVAGSGVYNFPLPFPASAAQIARGIVAPVFMNVSGVRVGFGFALVTSAGTGLNVFWWNNTGSLPGPLDSAGPGAAWANGMYLICNTRYEIA